MAASERREPEGCGCLAGSRLRGTPGRPCSNPQRTAHGPRAAWSHRPLARERIDHTISPLKTNRCVVWHGRCPPRTAPCCRRSPDMALDLCEAGSAGIGLLERNSDGPSAFRWIAVPGACVGLQKRLVRGSRRLWARRASRGRMGRSRPTPPAFNAELRQAASHLFSSARPGRPLRT